MAHVILCPYKSNSTWISVLVTLHTHKKGKHKYIIHTRHWRQKALGLPRRCPTISDVLGLSHRHARTGAHTITLQHNSASYMSTPFCNTIRSSVMGSNMSRGGNLVGGTEKMNVISCVLRCFGSPASKTLHAFKQFHFLVLLLLRSSEQRSKGTITTGLLPAPFRMRLGATKSDTSWNKFTKCT